MRVRELTGQQFGRLEVLERAGSSRGNAIWLCRCECGNMRQVFGNNLNRGETKSCGCLNREVAKARLTKHGRATTKEYKSWECMKQRCSNPNNIRFPDYGARGITVCDRWLESFENFFKDMGEAPSPKHSIDRINVNGNYEPGNCKWSTAKEQANNRRKKSEII